MAVKLEKIDFRNWSGGLNRSKSDFEIGDNELWVAENCLLDSAAIVKRKGYAKLNETPLIEDTEVLSVYTYGSYILANCGTKIFAITTTGVAVSIVTDLEAGYPVSYVVYDGVVYMSNGYNIPWKWDGVRAATTVDEDSANGQPILKVASTTDFEVGKTVVIDEGGDREETKIIDDIDGGVSLTMTLNLTYTHTALQADEVWSATTQLSGALPKAKWLVVHRDKLFYIATADNPNYVYFSQAGSPETIDANAFFIVYTDDNQDLTGAASLFGYLMLFKESSMHRLAGASKAQLTLASNLVSAHPKIGCVAANTIIHVPGGLMFSSNDGVQFTDTTGVIKRSTKVDYFFKQLAKAHKDKCAAFWDGKRYRMSHPTGTSLMPDESLIYDLDFGCWSLFTYGMNAYDRAPNGTIYAASGDGQIYIIDSGLSDDEAAIEMKVLTKVFDSGTPDLTKMYRRGGINFYRTAAVLETGLIVDRGLSSWLKELEIATGLTFWDDYDWATSEGTVSVTNEDPNVTGAGDDLDWSEIAAGDNFQVDGDEDSYIIQSVNAVAKTLVLTTNYGGATGAGKDYVIWNADTLFWIDPTLSYEDFSLPKRLKGKNIQVQLKESGDSSEIEIYSMDFGFLPMRGAR